MDKLYLSSKIANFSKSSLCDLALISLHWVIKSLDISNSDIFSYLVNDWIFPESTLIILPVDFEERSDAIK